MEYFGERLPEMIDGAEGYHLKQYEGSDWLKSKESIEPLKEKLRGDNEEDWEVNALPRTHYKTSLGKIGVEVYTNFLLMLLSAMRYSGSGECAMRTITVESRSLSTRLMGY